MCTPRRYCDRREQCSRRGPCSLVIAVIDFRFRGPSPVATEAIRFVAAVPPNGFRPAGRAGTIVDYVNTLSLLLSPWDMLAPGSCSPVCTPGQDCHRRELCSHRGHVRPCLHPVATVFAVGYAHIGVMFTRHRCYTIVGYEYALSLLSPWVIFARGHVRPESFSPEYTPCR